MRYLDWTAYKKKQMKLLSVPTGFIFSEDDSIAPVNGLMRCDSFMKIKRTKYEHLLYPDHNIKPSSDDERDIILNSSYLFTRFIVY